ncbi:MAG: hypothetical protein ACHQ49_10270 [Elusimicrobiota bacterium]
MKTRVIVLIVVLAGAAAIWSLISPLFGLRGGQISDPAAAGAPR